MMLRNCPEFRHSVGHEALLQPMLCRAFHEVPAAVFFYEKLKNRENLLQIRVFP